MNVQHLEDLLYSLEKKLFTKPGMIGLIGDFFKQEILLKTISDNGKHDQQMADIFQNWLNESKVIYIRKDYRHFIINAEQLYNALLK